MEVGAFVLFPGEAKSLMGYPLSSFGRASIENKQEQVMPKKIYNYAFGLASKYQVPTPQEMTLIIGTKWSFLQGPMSLLTS